MFQIMQQVDEAEKLLKSESFDDFGKLLNDSGIIKKVQVILFLIKKLMNYIVIF